MKRTLLILTIVFSLMGFSNINTNAETEPTVKIEIPASSVDKIDVKYEKDSPSVKDKAITTTKDVTDKTVEATKRVTKKTIEATKDVTDKTVKATKKATKKTIKATKNATDKTVEATKNFTDKTVEETKDFVESINPNREITAEGLEKEAAIKTLKNERNELKAAYNSRIKDIDARIKATEKSTTISDVEKQSKVYTLNKQKKELISQRDKAVERYNHKIELQKKNNK